MIDWTKPIETNSGREARLIGEINSEPGVRWVVAVASYDGHFEELGYCNAGGQVVLVAGGLAQIRNIPEKPAVAIARMFRHRISHHIEVWRVAPNPDWELIAQREIVEGEGMT